MIEDGWLYDELHLNEPDQLLRGTSPEFSLCIDLPTTCYVVHLTKTTGQTVQNVKTNKQTNKIHIMGAINTADILSFYTSINPYPVDFDCMTAITEFPINMAHYSRH